MLESVLQKKTKQKISIMLIIALVLALFSGFSKAAYAAEDVQLTDVTLNYVKLSDKTVSYDATVGTNYYDAKTYELDGQKYLRVSVLSAGINLQLVIDGVTPTEVSSIYNAENAVIGHVYDYAIASFTDPIVGKITYQAGPQQGNHPMYIIINQDAKAETRAALKAKLAEANAIANKSTQLTQAIAAAAAVDHLLSREAELAAQLQALTTAVARETLQPAAVTLNYVKLTDKTVSYDATVGTNYYDAKTYELDGQKYLRVSVLSAGINLQLVIDGVTPIEVSSIYNAENAVIGHVYDYAIASFTDPIVGKIIYQAGPTQGNHPMYIVINQDAKAETRAALKAKLAEANAIANKSTQLSQAIAAAAAVDHLLSREAELLAQLQALTTAVANASGGGGTAPVDPNQIPNGTYSLNFTILKEGTTQASVMDGYTVHPATLVANNGVYSVTLRLTQSKEITGFKVNGVAPTTVSSNAEKNTRDVKFTVSDLSQIVNGWVKIDWDAVSYHEEYNINIKFGSYFTYTEPGWTGNPSIPSTPEEEEEETTDPSTEQPGTTFKDVEKHWANESIKRAVQLGIVNGYSNGTFKPDGVINRAEFTAMISRALKLQASEGGASLNFSDLSSIPAWAKPFIEQAAAAGIISGYADDSFRPAQEISRTEIAVMVVKALGLPLEPAASLAYADANSVPEYAKAAVATAVKYGLLQGKGNNKFDPLAHATRAEALTLILRALDFAAAQAAQQTAAK
ncbi:S-layer homology domain-containing protein [Paenibacillus sp. ATY16]|uniref:S-layer homology domain-containing protein n=1 Tax=Paenibacillus sp. ATY16 TaxID=1759312 RepID=UPI000E2EB1B7|nr:S-layer homology domain-containing protein [Paenibacillus sp. ATY16]MCK9858447.1 S-layer homology domain-containing protein [Paenibacillus sp. ATY16]